MLLSVHCSAVYSSQDVEATYMPSTEEWMKIMCYIYTMEYSPTTKKNEIMPFSATRADLKRVSYRGSQTEEKCHTTSLIRGIYKEMIQKNSLTKHKEIHRLRE